jgi:hypothetical protein
VLPNSEFMPPVRLALRPYGTRDGLAFADDDPWGWPITEIEETLTLFMENYEIERVGYHDTHDNMTNINLDYGAALAAIAIESVARAATERPPG